MSKTITETEATNKIAKTVSKFKNGSNKRNDYKAPKAAPVSAIPPSSHPYNRNYAHFAKPSSTAPPPRYNTNKNDSMHTKNTPNKGPFLGRGQHHKNRQT